MLAMENKQHPACELVILRGLPGSSKSTTAKARFSSYKHFEADMFFMLNEEREYRFDASKLFQAHMWCQRKVKESLEAGNSVVVSNTSTTLKELKPYIEMAQSLNVPVRIIHCQGKFRNVHGVPQAALDKMKARWQPYPGEEIYKP